MTNIKDYPELINPSDADWILIQENATIPAYKKTQLINIRSNSNNNSSNSNSSSSWEYRDGSIDLNLDSSRGLIVDTPRDVEITLSEDIPEKTEIKIKRIREDNNLSIAGLSKIKSEDISADSQVKIKFTESFITLIYINNSIGWLIFPESSFSVSAPLFLPADGLIQLFDASSIEADDGDRIALWEDLVGERDAIQPDSSYQPEYKELVFNGGTKAGIFFVALQEFEVDFSYLANQKYTIAVVEIRTYSGQNYFLGTTNRLHIGYRTATDFTFAQYGDDLDASIDPYDSNQPATLWLICNSSRGKEIYKNGTLIDFSTSVSDLPESKDGRIGSALGSGYDGYIGLVAVWLGEKSHSDLDDINVAVNQAFGVY